jgi:curved DNA-binding protein CbpA
LSNEVLIIGSQRDYCRVIKEFLELRDLDVTVLMDYKTGIDRLFEDKPALSVIEITEGEISPALITKIRDSKEFSIPDFTSKNQTQTDQNQVKLNQVLMLDDTSQINDLFDYLKANIPEIAHLEGEKVVVDEGSLDCTFYPILLVEIYRKGASGILSISSESDLNIYFKNGSPVYAEGGEREAMIGRILLNTGRIDPETHRDILEKSKERKMRVGEVLIDSGIITPHELSAYLELQIEEKVLRGFCRLSGKYSFREDAQLPDGVVEHDIKLPKTMNEAVKRFVYAEKIEDINPQIKLASKPQSIINNMELKPKELRMVQLLKNNMSVKDILSQTKLEKYEALKLLYLLGLFKVIELHGLSLESIGRKSVERYISENKIATKAQESPEIIQKREELIELELEVYESEKGMKNGFLKSPEEISPTHVEDPEESSTNGSEDIKDISDTDRDMEDKVVGKDDDPGLFLDKDIADDQEVELSEELAEEAPGGLNRFDDSQVYEISLDDDDNTDELPQSETNPLAEEVSSSLNDDEPKPEDREELELALEPDNSGNSKEEAQTWETPLEIEINPEEIRLQSEREPEAQEIDPGLFSDNTDASETELESLRPSLQYTPKEISIDDTDLFSTFENEDHAFQPGDQLEEPVVLLKEEQRVIDDDNSGIGDEFVQRILEFHDSLPQKDYYQILGVAEDVHPEEIRDAYYKLVKDYHPDVNQNIPEDISEKAREIFTAINSAYETLSDSEKRENYSSQEQISELKTQAQSIYEAELEFKRGQALLTQRNYPEASAKLAEALKINPGESAYIGAYAWARYLASEDKNGIVHDLIEDLRRAIDTNSSIAENYYYLGSIYKNRDEIQKAEQNYEKALQTNPHYIEAKRELRLINTRKRENLRVRKDSKIEKRFWSSLFKK